MVELCWKWDENKKENNGKNYDNGNFKNKENNKTPTAVSRMIGR